MNTKNDNGLANSLKNKWKSRGKKYFKTRLVVAGFIFAIVGWFLLAVLLFGRFFEEELIQIERFVESPAFQWGLRAFILAIIIALIRKNEWLDRSMQNKRFRMTLYIFYGIGAVGWIWGIIDLLT